MARPISTAPPPVSPRRALCLRELAAQGKLSNEARLGRGMYGASWVSVPLSGVVP